MKHVYNNNLSLKQFRLSSGHCSVFTWKRNLFTAINSIIPKDSFRCYQSTRLSLWRFCEIIIMVILSKLILVFGSGYTGWSGMMVRLLVMPSWCSYWITVTKITTILMQIWIIFKARIWDFWSSLISSLINLRIFSVFFYFPQPFLYSNVGKNFHWRVISFVCL